VVGRGEARKGILLGQHLRRGSHDRTAGEWRRGRTKFHRMRRTGHRWRCCDGECLFRKRRLSGGGDGAAISSHRAQCRSMERRRQDQVDAYPFSTDSESLTAGDCSISVHSSSHPWSALCAPRNRHFARTASYFEAALSALLGRYGSNRLAVRFVRERWTKPPHLRPHRRHKCPLCRYSASRGSGDDDRRRQVRARLLGRVCGVSGGHRGSVLSPSRPHGVPTRSGSVCPAACGLSCGGNTWRPPTALPQ
jgi:hypothetical protein